jgi:hypothetical protein
MFQVACTKARNFTWPVVISRRTFDGQCSAGIGTFTVINKDGWIATAAHIFKVTAELAAQEAQNQQLRTTAKEPLNRQERRRLRAQAGRAKDAVINWSAWWGQDRAQIEPNSIVGIEVCDIAIARLVPFDPSVIKEYPVFKKRAGDDDGGVSVCRSGFPLWDVKPEWNAVANVFNLTQNVPLPLFSNEGIIARQFEQIILDPQGQKVQTPFRLRSIETSNPGLLGQSGGPIFDRNGVVWGIQTSTVSYKLDLGTETAQYYNVGVGCHAETLIGLMNARNIEYQSVD